MGLYLHLFLVLVFAGMPGLSARLDLQKLTREIEKDMTIGLGEEVKSTEPMDPNEGVIFLKTHKTGGSTLVNIFRRNLCEPQRNILSNGTERFEKNRNCFLPNSAQAGKTWKPTQDWDRLVKYSGNTWVGKKGKPPFEVWLQHVRYDKILETKLVPSAKRVISIVRSPNSRFISAYYFYGHKNTTGMSMYQLVSKIEKGKAPTFDYACGLDATIEEVTGRVGFSYKGGKRHMSQYYLDTAINQLVARVRSGKLILLVTDRYDESLLVLQKIMNWEGVGSIANIPLKDRHSGVTYKSDRDDVAESLAVKADKALNSRITALQPYDTFMYKLANRALDNLLTAWFPDKNKLALSLLEFSDALSQLRKTCNESQAEGSSKFFMGIPCPCFTWDNRQAIIDTWDELDAKRIPPKYHCYTTRTLKL